MNYRTLTTAVCFVALGASAFSGCAAEETSPGNPTNGAGGSSTTTANTTTGAGTSTTGAGTSTTGAGTSTTGAGTATSTTGSSTTGGTTGGTTTGGTTGSATTGGGPSCSAPPATGTDPMIDDFEDNDHTILTNEGRVGYWYVYDDASGGTATLVPVDGTPSTDGALHFTGSGFTDWGAGFGVDLNNDNSTMMSCDYDASIHTGIQFDITTDVAVAFQVAMAVTETDSDHYSISIPAATSGTFQAPFAMLMQGGWGTAATWDPKAITKLQWQVPIEMAFDITVDNVSFY